MSILDISEFVENWYKKRVSRNLVSGGSKVILTDGKRAIEAQQPFPELRKGEYLFQCHMLNGEAVIKHYG